MAEVHSGLLSVKIKGIIKNKKYPNAWCVLFSGRGNHPARFDIYDSSDDSQNPAHLKKSIYLETPKWEDVNGLGSAFAIDIKGKHYTFISPTPEACENWVSILCCVNVELSNTKDIVYKSLGIKPASNVVQHNDIYDTMTHNNSGNTFAVVPEASEDCKRLKLEGNYNLVIAPQSIRLCRSESSQADYEWDYRHLKDFGHSKNVFFFKSGSRSSTGNGYFGFLTPHGDQIVGLAQKTISQMKDRNDNNVSQTKPHAPPAPLPKPVLRPTISVESTVSQKPVVGRQSSESSSQSSKVDKKERKKLEKEEKKRRKKEEEEKKKLLKRDKKSMTKNPPPDTVYSEPDISYTPSQPTTPPVAKPVYAQPYQNATAAGSDYTETQVYSDPWENRPLPSPTQTTPEYEENVEELYACANKRDSSRPVVNKRDADYEDVTEDYTPPVIPPKQYEEQEESNPYEHLSGVMAFQLSEQENVYGMASAKPLENIYEQTKYNYRQSGDQTYG